MDSPAETARPARRTVIALLVVTAVLLLPLLGVLWYAAEYALQHKSTSDWVANHQARKSLENAALLIFGVPMAGAACGWTGATVLGRRPGVPTATGALTGTIAVWIVGIVAIGAAFSNATFDFCGSRTVGRPRTPGTPRARAPRPAYPGGGRREERT
ncbi:hypothetical protein [Streptomyces sp. NBC_01794]|uniref:hypothetical protein n=1 Tax=Streptomyces sp. NBC_01794 TaxID=2975942 RepID=UPI0030904C88|nr:hypothetical protein OIE54_17865 [Streptomyces sp. NBC_01794]